MSQKMSVNLALKWHIYICLLLFASTTTIKVQAHDVVEQTTMLDGAFVRSIFHTFRDFGFRWVQSTANRQPRNIKHMQEPHHRQFPCDLSMRSAKAPDSVHRLRPGDFNVIAALGDSLTAASGAMSTRFQDLFMENRGLSWSIGGQWDWRNSTTLPNILKAFNSKLVGYSRDDAFPFHEDTQFNMAEIGAVSADLPYMAKAMVQRIRRDRRIQFKHDWKLVTLCMGGNDICSFICTMDDPDSLPEKHRKRLITTLRYLRDFMPRTFVNLVAVPTVSTVMSRKNKPIQCELLHRGECSCWVGRLYNQTKEHQNRYHRIQLEMQAVEKEVASMKEFRNLKEFAVVHQPFTTELSLATEKGDYDLSLLAFDCFHMSQKGHSWAGVSLWNNMLQPPANKTLNWVSPLKRFLCPTREHPFIFTNDNVKPVVTEGWRNNIT